MPLLCQAPGLTFADAGASDATQWHSQAFIDRMNVRRANLVILTVRSLGSGSSRLAMPDKNVPKRA
ncbi:protein of unknown function (plasmid) [Pararobbsia alpina]